jgi:chromate transport protein ChrA
MSAEFLAITYGVVVGLLVLLISLRFSDEPPFRKYMNGIISGASLAIIAYLINNIFGLQAALVAGVAMLILLCLFLLVVDTT